VQSKYLDLFGATLVLVIRVTSGDDWRNSYCLIEGDVILRYDGWVTTRCRERKGLEALIS
jgi:hypothetical protein